MMLAKSKVVAFVATKDPVKAKHFYGNTLGLSFVSEDLFALVFDGNGTMVRVSIVKEFTPAFFTVLGWDVKGIRLMMKSLSQKGVMFEKVTGIPQDELGVWRADRRTEVAWFKDPDGNLLSLTEFHS